MCTCVLVCICACMHAYEYKYTYMPVEIRGWCEVSFLVALHLTLTEAEVH